MGDDSPSCDLFKNIQRQGRVRLLTAYDLISILSIFCEVQDAWFEDARQVLGIINSSPHHAQPLALRRLKLRANDSPKFLDFLFNV